MTAYEVLRPYTNLNPMTPRPDDAGKPYFVTVQDAVHVIYSEDTIPTCGARVVHPTNSRAPSTNLALSMLYVPPGARMERHEHEAEETYVIQTGTGTMLYQDGTREVSPGDFIYLPAWCQHGIENTGREMLSVLLALTPPKPVSQSKESEQ